MSLSDEMTRDFLALREEVPVFLSCGDAFCMVLVSQDSRSHDLALGGFSPKRSISVRALRAELPDNLKEGALALVDGISYRVGNIAIRPGLPIVSLELTEP